MSKADMECIVSKESAAQIHVVFMGQGLQPEALEQRRLKGDYAKVVAFRPTGESCASSCPPFGLLYWFVLVCRLRAALV